MRLNVRTDDHEYSVEWAEFDHPAVELDNSESIYQLARTIAETIGVK